MEMLSRKWNRLPESYHLFSIRINRLYFLWIDNLD